MDGSSRSRALAIPRRIRYSLPQGLKKMRKTAPLLAVTALFLMSCVGIDSRMTIRDNGAGTLSLTYRVSQLIAGLGDASEGRKVIPLPLTRSDFERSLESAKGKVRLVRFDRSENEKDVVINVELAFDSLDALAGLDAFRGAEIKTGSDGAVRTFSQLIAHAPRESISEDSLRMVDAFFKGYDLTFAIEAPRPIKSSTLGTLSDDKRTLTYKTSVGDVVRTKNDLVLSMSW